VIDAGIEVEGVARGLFPGGVLVTGSKTEAQEKTMELLDANAMALFQPVFEKDGLLAAIDVLQFDDAAGEYAIHEIKSSTEINERHLYDLAFQVILLRKNGRKVSRACLVHLNPNYIRQGELDLGPLSDRLSGNGSNTRGAPSSRMICASSGCMERKSFFSVCRAISAIAPEGSTPVGPAPTITNVSQERRCAGSQMRSATSKA
jgi:hypothetical protein